MLPTGLVADKKPLVEPARGSNDKINSSAGTGQGECTVNAGWELEHPLEHCCFESAVASRLLSQCWRLQPAWW